MEIVDIDELTRQRTVTFDTSENAISANNIISSDPVFTQKKQLFDNKVQQSGIEITSYTVNVE